MTKQLLETAVSRETGIHETSQVSISGGEIGCLYLAYLAGEIRAGQVDFHT